MTHCSNPSQSSLREKGVDPPARRFERILFHHIFGKANVLVVLRVSLQIEHIHVTFGPDDMYAPAVGPTLNS